MESVQRQLERAVSARVIAKGGQCEPGAAGGVEYVLVEIGENAVDQHLSRLADAAADDHHLRVNGGAYVAKELAHVGVIPVENDECFLVPGLACVEDVLAGQVFKRAQGAGRVGAVQMALGQTDDAGGGAVLLHAAPLSAVAGDSLVPVQDEVADLRAGAVGAVEQFPLHHDAAAHAGAQRDEDHVVTALSAALPEFAQRRHVGVVARLYGEAGQLGQLLGDVEHIPAQIDTPVHHALCVDGTGDTDAETQNVGIRDFPFGQKGPDGRRDIRQYPDAVFRRIGGNFPFFQHFSGFIKIGDLDGGAAEIDAKSVFHSQFLLRDNEVLPPLYIILAKLPVENIKKFGTVPMETFCEGACVSGEFAVT